ncbi:MAG: D-Ala-D-Ala carboxypeptidase family metallohydrolase [Cyanobacteria bacterium J06635_11]
MDTPIHQLQCLIKAALASTMKVVITTDTFLKALPTQATRLKEKNLPDQLVTVKAGTILDIIDQFPYEGNPGSEADDHVFVQLNEPMSGHKGIRWFVYGLHAKVEGTEPNNNPKDKPAEPKPETVVRDFGPKISIPGISRPVGIYEPIYFEPAVSNFTWAEFTKGGTRIPVDATVTFRIVKLCKYLDEVRTFLGSRPIKITSGYRDPISNRSVGGARDSRHMYGDAVDFWVDGMDVVDVFYKLKSYHPRGGLAVGNGFVHLDLRPGSPARWTYPGGPRVSLW